MSSIKYRPDIDGLRAVAVIAVLLHHVWPKVISGGFIGVDVFFVISGYLITKIVAAEISDGSFSFASFYTRRARRLLPALMVVLIAVVAAGWFFLLPTDYLATLRASFAATVFSSNILFWRDLSEGYFAKDAKLNPLLHTWSLGVEEQFYLLFPIFLLLCARVFPGRTKHLVVVGIALSLGISILLIDGKSVAVFFLAPFRAWELLIGSAFALGVIPLIRNEFARHCAVGLGLLAICASTVIYSPATTFPGLAALLPVLGSAAVIHAGGQGLKSGPQSLISTHAVVYVGRISYSLYLWHWPLVVFAKYVLQIEIGLLSGLLIMLLSCVLAALSYHFVEIPFRASRNTKDRKFMRYGIATSIALAGISLAGVAFGGFENRVSEQARVFDRARDLEVPFKLCDRRVDWCVIGAKSEKPTLIFWGDSHMLAWAPAIDQELQASGRSAYLVVHRACPPVWGLKSAKETTCLPANLRVMQFLSRRTDIGVVVLAANWQLYLNPDRIQAVHSSGDRVGRRGLLESAISSTIEGLLESGVNVSIIGQVPTYGSNVPFELARNFGHLSGAHDLSASVDSFGPFLARTAMRSGAKYVDIASVMCRPDCEVQRRGKSLYKDEQHLSSWGALAYASLIREAIRKNQGIFGQQEGMEQ